MLSERVGARRSIDSLIMARHAAHSLLVDHEWSEASNRRLLNLRTALRRRRLQVAQTVDIRPLMDRFATKPRMRRNDATRRKKNSRVIANILKEKLASAF